MVDYALPTPDSSKLHFLTFTANHYFADGEGGPAAHAELCVDPEVGLRVAGSLLGMHTCTYSVLRDADMGAHEQVIRRSEQTEGRVLYYVQGARCLGLMKKKSVWCGLVRATTTFARSHTTSRRSLLPPRCAGT